MKKIKKNKAKHIPLKIVISLALIFFIVFMYLQFIVNPVLIEIAENKIYYLIEDSIDDAIYEVSKDKNLYDEIIKFSFDNNNKISFISVNSYQVTRLTREIIRKAEINFYRRTKNKLEIGLGTFSGMPILTEKGPKVKLNTLPIGFVDADYKSSFAQAGVNQTIHRIYINVFGEITIIFPTVSKKILSDNEVLITESIIVGDVPVTYLNSTTLDEMLNLVPDN